MLTLGARWDCLWQSGWGIGMSDAAQPGSNDMGERYQALHEFVEDAEQRLGRNAWGYLIGATETETTVARNRQALDSVAFRPRVLRDVSHRSTPATEFLGHRLNAAGGAGPRRLAGELPPRRRRGGRAGGGRRSAAVLIIVSSVTHPGLEASAAACHRARKCSSCTSAGDGAITWTTTCAGRWIRRLRRVLP